MGTGKYASIERVFADSHARTLVDVQGIARTVKKEYEHVADKKEMDRDTHFSNLTALVRAAGVGGANISRIGKDLLSALFRDEDKEERKKKKKRRKRNLKRIKKLSLNYLPGPAHPIINPRRSMI